MRRRTHVITRAGFALLLAAACRDLVTQPQGADPRSAPTSRAQSALGDLAVTLVLLPDPCPVGSALCRQNSSARAINDEGTAVGRAQYENQFDPFDIDGALWPATGGIQRVSSSACPGDPRVTLVDINDHGDLLASCERTLGWSLINNLVIPPPPGYFLTSAVAVNEQTEVIGYGMDRFGALDQAFVWTSSGGTHALGPACPPTCVSSHPRDLNDSGMVVGVVGARGVLWDTRRGTMTDLATAFGVTTAFPTGINNRGEIVGSLSGYSGGPMTDGGFFWSPVTGLRIIDSSGATAINDSSVVVGNGYVWTPRHGRLSLVLPTGGWDQAGITGRINNRNQIPGVVLSDGASPRSRAAHFDLELPSGGNLSPVANTNGPYAALEGSPVAFDGSASFDPENQTLTFAWTLGDGTMATAPTFNHTYADNGTYTVRLEVSDPEGASGVATTTAMIENVAPSVHVDEAPPILSGDTFTLRATFFDPGVRDMPWHYTVHWGVGVPTEGSTNTQAGAIEASSPRYCAAGARRLTVSVRDKDGGIGAASMTLSVTRLEIPVTVLPHTLNPAAKGELPVAVIGTSSFDVSQLDVESATLGDGGSVAVPVTRHGKNEVIGAVRDVNGDGRRDVVLHFSRAVLESLGVFTPPTTHLVLLGRMKDGCREIRGDADARTLSSSN
jgi:PKD domain